MNIFKKNREIILLGMIVLLVSFVFPFCQSGKSRELKSKKLRILKMMNERLDEKDRYDQTPEGQRKLKQQVADDNRRLKKLRCQSIWDRSKKIQHSIMGVPLFLEKFDCRDGKLYHTHVLQPGS